LESLLSLSGELKSVWQYLLRVECGFPKKLYYGGLKCSFKTFLLVYQSLPNVIVKHNRDYS